MTAGNLAFCCFRGFVIASLMSSALATIVLSGISLDWLGDPQEATVSLIFLLKGVASFLFMTLIVLQDITRQKTMLLTTVWCEMTWISINAVLELGCATILVHNGIRLRELCSGSETQTICIVNSIQAAFTATVGLLLSVYLVILVLATINHSRKYAAFHLFWPVRDFPWFPPSGVKEELRRYPAFEQVLPQLPLDHQHHHRRWAHEMENLGESNPTPSEVRRSDKPSKSQGSKKHKKSKPNTTIHPYLISLPLSHTTPAATQNSDADQTVVSWISANAKLANAPQSEFTPKGGFGGHKFGKNYI